MYRSRLIPVLLIQNKYVVKTINFKNPSYVGEPVNIVRLFNDKEADELVLFDIDAYENNNINYDLLTDIATNARMPLCYGGGIKDVNTVEKIFSAGLERVSIGKMALENKNLISDITKKFGSQSCVVTLNIDKNENSHYFIKHEKKIIYEAEIKKIILNLIKLGVGEIIINCVHKDGTQEGYDELLIKKIYDYTLIPITIVGGASSIANILDVEKKFPMLGLGAGSLFTYKGKKKAVLINYPENIRSK
tara:strand:+ start:29 stop:772 length:744 start_codon:yes stop_codon:yes gene_type:complete